MSDLRREKIRNFLLAHTRRRWCAATICESCLGCINKKPQYSWKSVYPDDPEITQDEFDSFLNQLVAKIGKSF